MWHLSILCATSDRNKISEGSVRIDLDRHGGLVVKASAS